MKKLSRNEYIAIVVALVVALLFFLGFNFWSSFFNSASNGQLQINNQNQMDQGLTVNVTNPGSGPSAAAGDLITVNYTGTLTDGTKFDSSYDRGTPFQFQLGQGMVIKGWDEGLMGSKVGEKLTITVPPLLGYGQSGIPDGKGGYVIPPNSTLIFDIEVMAINKAGEQMASTTSNQ